MDSYQVIKKPLVTEKAMLPHPYPRYAFVVDRWADKVAIRKAVEKLFKVHVTQVNTSIIRGKFRRVGRSMGKKPNWKKAFVTLKEGEKIEIFEGV